MVKPLVDSPPQLKKEGAGRILMTRHYELITPLFGGGATTNVVDQANPVRGTAIRGHLRFWWRATCAGQFGKAGLADMKKAEDKIWGTAAKDPKPANLPRPVQLAIQIITPGSPIEPFTHQPNKKGQLKPSANEKSGVPAYAAFPLQRTDEEIKAKKNPYSVQQGITFTLTLNFPQEYRKDVETTLWAWETFGGIGARTRRGFGALYCTAIHENGRAMPMPTIACDAIAIKKNLKEQLQTISGEWPEHVPHLSSTMFIEITATNGDALHAWDWIIGQLRAFRQSREGSEYGPTHWPEANAVRKAAGKPVSSKSPHIGTKFPRAQLGLPIIFHFPQERNFDDATLTGLEKDRMASKLILRPLSCGQNKAVALAAVLAGPTLPDGGIALDGRPVKATLSQPEASKITPLNGEPTVIKAFFNFIRKNKLGGNLL
ncbi:MAG: type III-B CRISPR module RAMP protein Cmr1 [Anaerolineales bacterium]|nr:type III-B CRISPR module RAMP protein Cmr1 [Anaerolineales bacterium]